LRSGSPPPRVRLRRDCGQEIVGAMSTVSAAIELPWQELQGNLRGFIARRVRHHADVDDLVQRVLLQIVAGLGALRDAERLHAWVYRVARNAIIDYYRSPTVRRELASGDAADLMAATAMNGPAFVEDERTAFRELARCLAPMIRQLPAPYQDAISMTDLEGLTQADAAKRAGISVSGMKSRVQRARQQLRAIVDACCMVELDRRGSIVSYAPRRPKACSAANCG
jgi:RNA polymerase sigma-70 factor (ECF subfamily)